MTPSNGLVTALNKMREASVSSSSLYHQYIPIITNTSSINVMQPVLEVQDVRNEFMNQLVKRIVETQVEARVYKNKFAQLEGEEIPLGYSVQDIFVNRARGRKFNVSDFLGLLQRYESDIKIQYHNVNMDTQYPVTITRAKLKNAFVSWTALEDFITGITNSIFSGAQIDQYLYTKYLVANAFRNGHTVNKVITAPTDAEKAKAFAKEARTLYLNFQEPTSDYNAWGKVNTDDNKAIVTWTDPEDVVFILRNDIISELDVDVLSVSFHMDKSSLMGRIIGVKDFDIYDDEGNKIYDGSKILGIMADKRWFKIRSQDAEFDTFYNPNNRTTQLYFNLVKLYSYSYFANAVVFCTEEPESGESGTSA